MLYGSSSKPFDVVRDSLDCFVYSNDTSAQAASVSHHFDTFGDSEALNKVTAVSELQSPARVNSPNQLLMGQAKQLTNVTVKNSASKKEEMTEGDFDPYQNRSV